MTTLDLLSLARQAIAIDSTTDRSNRELVEFLLPLCEAAGLEASAQEEIRDGVAQYNLLASRRPVDGDGETLVLNTHLDTVAPGDHRLWDKTGGDPFALTEHDGLLYGLGVADVKLDFLCKLLALRSLRRHNLQDNVVLAGTYAEETAGYGAHLLVRELTARTEGRLPGRILVGEPTRLRPCISHKGYVEFRTEACDPAALPAPDLPCWRLVFHGVSAHSSQPHRGASATTACLDALASLVEDDAARGSSPGVAVLSIKGGDAVNKVAAWCEAVVAAAQAPDPQCLQVAATKALASAEGATGAPAYRGPGADTPPAGDTPPVPMVTCSVTPTTAPDGAVWSPHLLALLLALHALSRRLEQRLRAWQLPGFDPPYSTVNNGLVELSGDCFNFAVDVRRVAGDLPAGEIDDYERSVEALGKEGGVGAGLNVTSERMLESDPFRAEPRSRLLGALMVELGVRGLPVAPDLKSGATEAPVYHEAGMEVIIFGPGHSLGNIHRPNEHIALADLETCVEVYRGLILRVCGASGRH